MTYERANLKQQVRQSIKNTRPRPIWVTLLYVIVAGLGAYLIQMIVNLIGGTAQMTLMLQEIADEMGGLSGFEYMDEEMLMEFFSGFFGRYADQIAGMVTASVVAGFLGSIVVTLWNGLMTTGYNGYCLSLVRDQNPAASRVFCGFQIAGKAILTWFLLWVFTTLWSLLYWLIFAVLVGIGAAVMTVSELAGGIVILAAVVLLAILVIRLSLRYAMTGYFMVDTGLYGLDAITASKRMMKGKKGKLFGLYLSFIGWYILIGAIWMVGILVVVIIAGVTGLLAGENDFGAIVGVMAVCVIGMLVVAIVTWLIDLWLTPYVNGSVAKFYDHFKPEPPAAPPVWEAPAAPAEVPAPVELPAEEPAEEPAEAREDEFE